MYIRIVFKIVVLWLLSMQIVFAQNEPDPANVVFQVTTDVLEAVQANKEQYEEDPAVYFQAIDDALGSNVNFERMAYLVMDATYYRASTDEQKERFVEAFKTSLVETYSKGLLAAGNPEFTVLPVNAAEGAQTVTVEQELVDGVFEMRLDYSMRREPDGRWLLVNVVIDGINLGSTFRNQFAQLARRYNGDLDRVIDAWSSN